MLTWPSAKHKQNAGQKLHITCRRVRKLGEDLIGWDLCVLIIRPPLGASERDGKYDGISCSGDSHVRADPHEVGACGSSSVTAAYSQGGDTSGVAPHIREAYLSWPWINFSLHAEMTGIVIKEME